MAFRAIITDLDRTLLRTDKSVSSYTAGVLRACGRAGLRIALATARPVRAVRQLGLGGLYDAAIYHNGAVVHTGDKEIAHFGIATATALEIIGAVLAQNPDIRVSAEADDILYANFDMSDHWPGAAMVTTDFASLPGAMTDKIILSGIGGAALAAMRQALPRQLYCQTDREGLTFIMHRGATKLNGLHALLAHWGLAPGQAVAFGDDTNDADMLTGCGLGVAVANATAGARAAAGTVCGSNDEDGVACWLEAHVLNGAPP